MVSLPVTCVTLDVPSQCWMLTLTLGDRAQGDLTKQSVDTLKARPPPPSCLVRQAHLSGRTAHSQPSLC